MKRSRLKRRAELRADPAKVAAFVQRGRGALERTAPKRRAALPAEVRAGALDRSSGRCIMCRHHGVARWADHLHHLLEVRNFPSRASDSANLIGLCADCHDDHERANRRVPWDALPSGCCAYLLEAASVDGMAERTIAVCYPRRADPGTIDRRKQ